MDENGQSEIVESPLPDNGPIASNGMIATATQVSLFLTLSVMVVVALFFDSRLYYGVGVDGQPIYQEHPHTYKSPLDVRPVSESPAVGGFDPNEPRFLPNAAFLDIDALKWLPASGGESHGIMPC